MDSAGAIFVLIVFVAIIVVINRLIRKGVSAGVKRGCNLFLINPPQALSYEIAPFSL